MIVQGPVKEQQPDGMSHRGAVTPPPRPRLVGPFLVHNPPPRPPSSPLKQFPGPNSHSQGPLSPRNPPSLPHVLRCSPLHNGQTDAPPPSGCALGSGHATFTGVLCWCPGGRHTCTRTTKYCRVVRPGRCICAHGGAAPRSAPRRCPLKRTLCPAQRGGGPLAFDGRVVCVVA